MTGFCMKQKNTNYRRTNPTDKQKKQMRLETNRLKDFLGGYKSMSIVFNVPYDTSAGWVTRGRVPVRVADAINGSDLFEMNGFTRETLRPDVKFWEDDEPIIDLSKNH